MADHGCQIHLPVFDGPFDLLLHLIREEQVDIYDIPIARITDQYLEYLARMEELDLDIASEFLVMAANLLAIKARMLLPKPPAEEGEPEEDARSELVHDLLEYMQFKEAAAQMSQLHETSARMIRRPNEQELYVNLFSAENPLSGKTLSDLQQAFSKVLDKAAKIEPVLSVHREQVTLRDKLEELFYLIGSHPEGLRFSEAFAGCSSRMELVVTFLALLELIRQQVIRVSQDKQCGEIYMFQGESKDYDRDVTI